jgi:hypothetical protein
VHRGSEVAKWMLSKVAKFLTTSTLSNKEKIKHLKFRTLMFADNDFYHEKFMADRSFNLRFFAAARLLPVFSYNTNEEEFKNKGEVGVISVYGMDFQNPRTNNFQLLIQNFSDEQLNIDLISYCIKLMSKLFVESAIDLANRAGKKNIILKLSAWGVGEFLKFFKKRSSYERYNLSSEKALNYKEKIIQLYIIIV